MGEPTVDEPRMMGAYGSKLGDPSCSRLPAERVDAMDRGRMIDDRAIVDSLAAEHAIAADELMARLRHVCTTVENAWGEAASVDEPFLRHVLAKAAAVPGDLLQALGAVQASDLYIAFRAAHRDDHALAAMRDQFLPCVRAVVRRMGGDGALAAEIETDMLTELVVAEGGAPPLLSYAGRGSLRSWLRSIAARSAARRLKRTHVVEEDQMDLWPDASEDPEIHALKRSLREQLRPVLEEALDELTARDRNLLRHAYFDGLTVDQLATMYDVHRATAARWVASARQAVLSGVRRKLMARMQLRPMEVDSVVRLVQSRLEVSIRRLLGAESVAIS